ncbi:T. brucei spp.-specific protein [Trypanosoma brucei gambiense DAL972]|uniref:T. brucei spp.-specific protein n=2 Tax=Trypanosoma brucei TaxID=5691 RepID=D0A5W8_TRYB9|nr:T. brucei spp.-specific protein [Trypanosoma brucei gambiense DAL972]RHW68095.1 hypothetical protein DPX39_110023500 [Trypanosoma brucei equiperdum]CBH17069.1 T. brucei spp.-specific protein [Trypanosoma brucei gambiense DAL972]|eukprot:XP_011779333.1 T. brucei spp.-specific protein [Trypanosoma brucei gambiense DAL972]
MGEFQFHDEDAEAAVIFVSFQTLLSQECVGFIDNVRSHVPVEGHYLAIGHPWGPPNQNEILYDGGFAYMPSCRDFCCQKKSVEDWMRRVKYIHGIAPNIGKEDISKLKDSSGIKKAQTNFLEAQQKGDKNWLPCRGNPDRLVEQLFEAMDAVQSFRYRHATPLHTGAVVFLTTRDTLNMARVSIHWLLSQQPDDSMLYTVQAIEDIIPACSPLVDAEERASPNMEERCPIHSDRRNQPGNLYRCCRAETGILRRVAERLGDYISSLVAEDEPEVVYPLQPSVDCESDESD